MPRVRKFGATRLQSARLINYISIRITLFAAKSDSIVELLWKSTAMLKIQAVSVNLFVNRILVKTSTFSRNGKNLLYNQLPE